MTISMPAALSSLARALTALLLLAAGFSAPALGADAPDPRGAELIEAAQLGEVATARALLEAGVAVDSKNRYGATALFFAADKGNLELVNLLLERGADVDVVDTFYNASPVAWTLFKIADDPETYRPVLLRLLRAEPANTDPVLLDAANRGDRELVDAVMALERTNASALRTAADAADEAEHGELAEHLRTLAKTAPEPESFDIPREQLERFVGQYKNAEIGFEAAITLDDDTLKVQAAGQPALGLLATGERSFDAVGVDGVSIVFRGRGGIVEGLVLNQGGREFEFSRVSPEESASTAPEETSGKAEAKETTAAASAPLPAAARQPARPWPSFRGPSASGNGDGQGAPASWDGAEGTNVLWKTPIPGIGLSSPIVWRDRIYVTTAISSAEDDTFRIGLYGDVDSVDDASKHLWKIYALDRSTGEIVWDRIAAEGEPKVARHTKSSHANPTPVTDGRYVVAHFGSEGIFCYTADGELKWHVEVPKLVSGWFYDPTYEWGYASSPILHDGLVIVQTDIQKGSYIAAYDLETGEERWRTARDEIPTWGTPTILPAGDRAEIVTNGTTIRGYDAATGEELWTLGPNSEVTVGTPVLGDGVAFVTGGYPPVRPIYAIRPGGRGDLSLADGETAGGPIVWSTTRGGTYIPTPIVYDDILYMLHNNGRLTAHDTTTGEELYRARVGTADSFAGSPVAADGRLFFTNEEGRTYVVRAGSAYEELDRNELGEIVMTTPAISDGTMIVRGIDHVWALGAPRVDEEAR